LEPADKANPELDALVQHYEDRSEVGANI